MFSSYEKNHDPQRAITFGDGNQRLVKGLGKIAISPDHSISNVFLVDSLDNLLSVSQLCKMGYNYCRRVKSPAGWRSAPALNPKMRRGLGVLLDR
jgi:hypothetical protein